MDQTFLPVIDSDTRKHPIQPGDIHVGECDNVLGGFGKHEVEVSAGKLVKFFQSRESWCKFTLSELAEFYRQNGWEPNEMLFGLMGGWYDDCGFGVWREGINFIGHTGKRLCISEYFIQQCAGKKSVTV